MKMFLISVLAWSWILLSSTGQESKFRYGSWSNGSHGNSHEGPGSYSYSYSIPSKSSGAAVVTRHKRNGFRADFRHGGVAGRSGSIYGVGGFNGQTESSPSQPGFRVVQERRSVGAGQEGATVPPHLGQPRSRQNPTANVRHGGHGGNGGRYRQAGALGIPGIGNFVRRGGDGGSGGVSFSRHLGQPIFRLNPMIDVRHGGHGGNGGSYGQAGSPCTPGIGNFGGRDGDGGSGGFRFLGQPAFGGVHGGRGGNGGMYENFLRHPGYY